MIQLLIFMVGGFFIVHALVLLTRTPRRSEKQSSGTSIAELFLGIALVIFGLLLPQLLAIYIRS